MMNEFKYSENNLKQSKTQRGGAETKIDIKDFFGYLIADQEEANADDESMDFETTSKVKDDLLKKKQTKNQDSHFFN